MSGPTKPINWTIFIWCGLLDVVVGGALVLGARTGRLGAENADVLAYTGAFIVVVGIFLALWARSNLKRTENRRGDLN